MINIVLPQFFLPRVAPVGRIFVYVFQNKQSINQSINQPYYSEKREPQVVVPTLYGRCSELSDVLCLRLKSSCAGDALYPS